MKRIIDIPDELYKKIMGHRALTKYQEHLDYEDLKNMVEDSTPLTECKAEGFIKYAKETYGVELTLKDSDNPDTYEKLFGTTKNDLGVDLILREQAKAAIRDKFKDLPSRVEINTILNELPAVTPQKIGHWIEHDWKEILGEGYYRCSVCNHGYQRYTKGIRKSDVPYINGKEYTLWNIDNYCPNCGAKMIEPQESEEQA